MNSTIASRIVAVLAAFVSAITAAQAQDPLPSWNDAAPKQAIIAFVEKVTKEGAPEFVPIPQRIAVFDNDGTLWAEQPVGSPGTELEFAL